MVSPEPIKSRDNRRLVELRKVRDGRDRSRIFIEGKRLAAESIRSRLELEECFFNAARPIHDIIDQIRDLGVPCHAVAPGLVSSIADTETSQGIFVVAKRPRSSLHELADGNGLTRPAIFLSEVSNPSNLGALLRTAEGAGVEFVIISKNSADSYSPKSLRASMGSAFRLKIIEGVSLSDAIDAAKLAGCSSVAVDVGGELAYTEVDWSKPRLVVFGSEAHGLSGDDLALIEEKIVIPMENDVESLNLAVAAGIVLFEAKKQRFNGSN